MNAAIQLLRSVPELNQALKKFTAGGMVFVSLLSIKILKK